MLSLNDAKKSDEYLGIKALSLILESHFNKGSVNQDKTKKINKIINERKKLIKAFANFDQIKFSLSKVKIEIIDNLEASYYLHEKLLLKKEKDFHINYKDNIIYIHSGDIYRNISLALAEKFNFKGTIVGTIENLLRDPIDKAIKYLNDMGIDISTINLDKIKNNTSENIEFNENEHFNNLSDNISESSDDLSLDDNLETNVVNDTKNKIKKTNQKIQGFDKRIEKSPYLTDELRIKGINAEDWLYKNLKNKFPDLSFKRNVRDAENKETDILILSDDDEFHIEIKRIDSGNIYWSELEYKKCLELNKNYFMAILHPQAASYDLYWLWNPINQLSQLNNRKKIWRWKALEKEGGGLSVGEWKFEEKEYPEKRGSMNYKIIINEEFLKTVDLDNSLDILFSKII